ncbi:hypothetical protein RHAL1_01335 [Beijerinckiaceae bacterium RH AL1]|nr:NAAT family transporter [Beijerinckiaceae bacterium]VVB44595.1 hypothetical protein RHCH11_RHCH11_01304 [Beijerinckiaceae bacterium RH CH11]VVB44673.1 hypothetical protein RHAL8_01301 [Beijerinckiaceae bacterium RH AL8]VVC54437.1 hypothetical protein RHAL1_01335 [Beijerinckiaceae bacterium RH AL1]
MLATATQAYLLALSALISIVNPVGSALFFRQVTEHRTEAERSFLAKRIAIYSAALMAGALWFGAQILAFFGVDLTALRIAGGSVIMFSAWRLLYAPDHAEAGKASDAAATPSGAEDAFFPLTLPFTVGPGTISVAIALSSNAPSGGTGQLVSIFGSTLAALTTALAIAIAYLWADHLISMLGRVGASIVTRLSAFLLLSIGVELILNGVRGFVATLK